MRITINNFKKLGVSAPFVLDLSEQNAVLLHADNGKGKTSVIQAIILALYGPSSYKDAKNFFSKVNKENAVIKIEWFPIGDREVTIERKMKYKPISGTRSVPLESEVLLNWVRVSEEELRGILPSYDEFQSTVNPEYFLSKTKVEQIRFVNSLFPKPTEDFTTIVLASDSGKKKVKDELGLKNYEPAELAIRIKERLAKKYSLVHDKDGKYRIVKKTDEETDYFEDFFDGKIEVDEDLLSALSDGASDEAKKLSGIAENAITRENEIRWKIQSLGEKTVNMTSEIKDPEAAQARLKELDEKIKSLGSELTEAIAFEAAKARLDSIDPEIKAILPKFEAMKEELDALKLDFGFNTKEEYDQLVLAISKAQTALASEDGSQIKKAIETIKESNKQISTKLESLQDQMKEAISKADVIKNEIKEELRHMEGISEIAEKLQNENFSDSSMEEVLKEAQEIITRQNTISSSSFFLTEQEKKIVALFTSKGLEGITFIESWKPREFSAETISVLRGFAEKIQSKIPVLLPEKQIDSMKEVFRIITDGRKTLSTLRAKAQEIQATKKEFSVQIHENDAKIEREEKKISELGKDELTHIPSASMKEKAKTFGKTLIEISNTLSNKWEVAEKFWSLEKIMSSARPYIKDSETYNTQKSKYILRGAKAIESEKSTVQWNYQSTYEAFSNLSQFKELNAQLVEAVNKRLDSEKDSQNMAIVAHIYGKYPQHIFEKNLSEFSALVEKRSGGRIRIADTQDRVLPEMEQELLGEKFYSSDFSKWESILVGRVLSDVLDSLSGYRVPIRLYDTIEELGKRNRQSLYSIISRAMSSAKELGHKQYAIITKVDKEGVTDGIETIYGFDNILACEKIVRSKVSETKTDVLEKEPETEQESGETSSSIALK